MLWQLIRLSLLSHVNLQQHPNLIHLKEETEDVNDFLQLAPETTLLRWFNHHLRNAGHNRRVTNFAGDVSVCSFPSFSPFLSLFPFLPLPPLFLIPSPSFPFLPLPSSIPSSLLPSSFLSPFRIPFDNHYFSSWLVCLGSCSVKLTLGVGKRTAIIMP